MPKSIIQKDMNVCYVCGTTNNLHTHEIFYGKANRIKSIKWGMQIRLCAEHHNMSSNGIHFDKKLDMKVKMIAQNKFEEKWGHEKFMEVFHKNYL